MKNIKNIPLFKVFMPEEVDAEVIKTLHSGYIAEGEKVKDFARVVGDFLGNKYVIPVSSGTMALTIAYELAEIGQGDEVITTPLTCVATNVPLLKLGAKIIWADCEPNTGMIDPSKLEALVTPKTKAIVVLHKDGDLAKIDEIMNIAQKYNIKVIEDAAHVFGASHNGIKVGNFGDYTCFSFQAIKHITTGDGGALVCKSEEDYKKARRFKWFGLSKDDKHTQKNIWMDDISIAGYKGNMNDLSASIGLVQMKYVEEIIGKFHANGELFTKLLKDINSVTIVPRSNNDYSVYWVYTLLADKRDLVMQALEENGVACSIVHPRNDSYSIFKKFKKELPGVDRYESRELSVPCGPWVEKSDIERIVEVIKKNA